MKQMTTVKRLILAAVCLALCVVLPMAFHSIPNGGLVFLPMHIPVLLCGLLCGWYFGLLCGILGPLLSSLLTGMPPMAGLPGMMVELAVYGLIAGLAMKLIHTKKLYGDLYACLLLAMIAGRVAGGVARALLFSPGAYSMSAWVAASLLTCWPGILLQLALVPALVFSLEKARLIPSRYPAAEANLRKGDA